MTKMTELQVKTDVVHSTCGLNERLAGRAVWSFINTYHTWGTIYKKNFRTNL